MSGPYRFTQEQARTPLDRRPQNPPSSGQPVSFKTNVNRMKTKKWVEAKKNAYDGDDWGDYDEYDEYGADQAPPPSQPTASSGPRGYGQQFNQPSRSFTEPQHHPASQPGRRNSFEAGEEHRAFSTSIGHPPQDHPQQPYGASNQPPGVHPALRQVSGAESDTSDTPQHRRDFSPTALPHPLQTRMSPAPQSATGSPASTRFASQKGSIGQADSPLATSPHERPPSNPSKPLPFIRPADIYKRHEEERQRASMESSSPVQDSVAAKPREDLTSPNDYGLRSVVDQAFVRSDEQRSVPPTPITNSDPGVSRSNTGSTSGISPIMSRVPSSAASVLKARNQAGGDTSTPVIAEESSETIAPAVRPTSAAMLGDIQQIPRKPSPSHSRNISSSSLPRSGLITPSPGESPARSPAIEPQKNIPEPEAAQLSTLSPSSPEDMEGGLPGPSPTYATREADIASAIRLNPERAVPELSAAEMESQKNFLDSHKAQSPIEDVIPQTRSESPNKGRVQELAGKFGEVSSSRRGSVQSNASRNSVQSWERSQDNSRPASPTKASSPTKEAFRPKLPGQWESYATNAATPPGATPLDQEKELGADRGSSPLGEVDLTPTTPKHPVSTPPGQSDSTSGPFSALKAAGAAVGDALQASIGRQPSQGEDSSQEHKQHGGYAHGDVLPRPLQLDRTSSSVSTIPPTPPAKDTPESEDGPGPISGSQPTTERPTVLPQLSTDAHTDDQESDRLRKEIVASLNPPNTSVAAGSESNQASLQPGGPPVNRESSLFPSEYDSYWADGDRTSPRPSQDAVQNTISDGAHANPPTDPAKTQSTEESKPVLLTRFSFEGQPQAQTSVPALVPKSSEEENKVPPPTVEQPTKENRDMSFGGFPDPYFGPAHSVAAEPVNDIDVKTRAPTPPPASEKPVASPTSPVSPPRSGLHVVNSALNPEAVDMPPRLSAETPPVSQLPPPIQEEPPVPQKEEDHEQKPPVPTTVPAQDPVAKSPTSDKPLGAKEISTIKSAPERIATYNSTRDYWARVDHGLSHWVASAVNTNPELATQPYPPPQPALASSATIRHRPAPSLSLFSKHHGSHQAEQSGASSSQAPYAPTSAPTQGGGRSASHQMQAKGKDLLHTAGVLGGKGMTGAKGLFAKGKSRFRSDKVDK